MPQFVEIEYLPDGTKKVEAVGFEGASCTEATKPFETGPVTSRSYKAEYYEEEGFRVRIDQLCG